MSRLRSTAVEGQDAPLDIPETRYAKTADGVHIAYQARGEGSVDLVYVMQYANNLEVAVEHPREARFLERLGSSRD